MKKLLACLLAVLLMLGGMAVAAGAETEALAEETTQGLEARGRALLMDTMEILRGDFTIHNGNRSPYDVVHSNGSYWLRDSDNDELHLANGEIYWVFPNEQYYHPITKEESVQLRYVRLLEPKEITAESNLSVTQAVSPYVPIGSMDVVFGGIVYTYGESGNLIEIRYETDCLDALIIATLTRTADQRFLHLDGYKEASDWQVSLIVDKKGPSKGKFMWSLIGNDKWGPIVESVISAIIMPFMLTNGVILMIYPVYMLLAPILIPLGIVLSVGLSPITVLSGLIMGIIKTSS